MHTQFSVLDRARDSCYRELNETFQVGVAGTVEGHQQCAVGEAHNLAEGRSGLQDRQTERVGPLPGQPAIVRAGDHDLDRALAPYKGASLTGTLKKMDGSVIGAATFRDDGPAGSYSTDVELVAAGAYRLQVSASDDKGLLETRELLLEAGVAGRFYISRAGTTGAMVPK